MLQVIKKIAVRTFLAVLILIVVVILGTLLALQTSPVQTWLAGKATDWVSEKLGFPVSIGRVDVHWVDHASFRDVVIQDPEHNRMIEVPELDVDFHFSTLIQGRDINIDDVLLNGAKVRLVKSRKTNTLNIDDFIIAINDLTATGDTTRSRRPPVFSIDETCFDPTQENDRWRTTKTSLQRSCSSTPPTRCAGAWSPRSTSTSCSGSYS